MKKGVEFVEMLLTALIYWNIIANVITKVIE